MCVSTMSLKWVWDGSRMWPPVLFKENAYVCISCLEYEHKSIPIQNKSIKIELFKMFLALDWHVDNTGPSDIMPSSIRDDYWALYLHNMAIWKGCHQRAYWSICSALQVRSIIILFSHGSFKIRHLLTLLHTPLSELDGKVDSTSSDLSWACCNQ